MESAIHSLSNPIVLGVIVAVFALGWLLSKIGKLDLNALFSSIQNSRNLSSQKKAVRKCSHMWTLYPQSHYSICNNCQALIATSTLLLCRKFRMEGLFIAGERWGMDIGPKAGNIAVRDPVGNRK